MNHPVDHKKIKVWPGTVLHRMAPMEGPLPYLMVARLNPILTGIDIAGKLIRKLHLD